MNVNAIAFILSNNRPEWRGAKDVGMQTGRAIPRPLQAARSVSWILPPNLASDRNVGLPDPRREKYGDLGPLADLVVAYLDGLNAGAQGGAVWSSQFDGIAALNGSLLRPHIRDSGHDRT